jgi:4-amino-4-deoxy-L-arabinose transferase-like glycosyltransferase
MTGGRTTRFDRIIAAVIFAGTLAALVAGAQTQGNVRDEGYYFDAAELYWQWYGDLAENLARGKPWRSFTDAAVRHGFEYNHEHPALMKSLSGISWRLLHKCHCPEQAGRHPIGYAHRHRTLALLDEETAFRLPTMLFVALMAAALYLFGAAAWSRAAGVTAAVLAVTAPRFFFDAQLATFDAPIAAIWVVTIYAYWRALDDRRWGWRLGVAAGLALATKHNGFFLPFILLPHFAFVAWQRRKLPSLRPWIWMALLSPVVYLACWPWLWFHTVARFGEYVAFHVHHEYYNMEYFGRNYNKPPFPLSFPYAMTALTLPLTTLVLALGGAIAMLRNWLRQRRETSGAPQPETRATGLLVFLNALFPMAILTVTRAPIFGATKHFHATIPFISLLAGYAVFALSRSLAAADLPWMKRINVAVALALLACAPSLAECFRAHPYGLTHYNIVAGGPAGGADLGMNRQFWGYASRGVLPWINAHARPGAPVYWHDTNQAQLNMDVREKRLRNDIGNTPLEEPGVRASDIALVIHERHFSKYEYWIWDFYGTARPSLVLDDEGVPIVTVYQRPNK